jgi:hypothetical protein
MPLALSRSTSFRHLQSRIGGSTYRLNTVLVGLEEIAAGGGGAGAVAVTWPKPKTPERARQAANQARIFACASALVLGADVFDSFLREFASEEWLGFAMETQAIATKAKTRPKEEGGAYSMAERAEALCTDLGLEDPIRIAALDLLATWRNVVAHSSDRRTRLTADRRGTLTDAGSREYFHFDIALALKNFEGRRVPVSKEVTHLVAIAVNFSRQIDESAIRRAAPTPDKMFAAAEQMLREYFRASSERARAPWSELADAWQGGGTRRRNMLQKFLANVGIAETQTPVSAPLPERFMEETMSLSRDDFARRFEIARP